MGFDRGHALVIGVGTYQHVPRMNVPITAADAEAVADVLCNPTFCGYPTEQVTLLHDAAASHDGILGALDALAGKISADDTVFLFYSGHGHYSEDQTYYLTTSDTQLTQNGKVTAGSAVSQYELLAKLRAIKARRMLLIFNACHSGEVAPVLDVGGEAVTGQNLPEATASALLSTGAGRIIITSCGEKQVAYVGDGTLTLFAQALVEGLQGGGEVVPNHGFISAFDLYTHLYNTLQDWVSQRIPESVRQRYSPAQEPELTVLKGVGPFAVALYRGATALGDISTEESPPALPAVRAVDPQRSQRLFERMIQIGGDVVGGDKIGGHRFEDVMINQDGGVNFGVGNQIGAIGEVIGGDKVAGNKVLGDQVGGDTIAVGNIAGSSGVAIGRSARADVRIGALPEGDSTMEEQLTQLIDQLNIELQTAPPDQGAAAGQVARRAAAVLQEATRPQPDKEDVQYSLTRLKQAAENVAAVLPAVPPIATKIAELVGKLIR